MHSVMIVFCFFSWKEPEPPPPDPNAVKPPMITEILQLEEEEAMAKVTAAANELADKLQGGPLTQDLDGAKLLLPYMVVNGRN